MRVTDVTQRDELRVAIRALRVIWRAAETYSAALREAQQRPRDAHARRCSCADVAMRHRRALC